ncbi:unnamed protein product [Urochloa humidicola]
MGVTGRHGAAAAHGEGADAGSWAVAATTRVQPPAEATAAGARRRGSLPSFAGADYLRRSMESTKCLMKCLRDASSLSLLLACYYAALQKCLRNPRYPAVGTTPALRHHNGSLSASQVYTQGHKNRKNNQGHECEFSSCNGGTVRS